MSIPFANLIQDIVNFNSAIPKNNSKDPQATAKLEEAAKHLRHAAFRDVSCLAYMGG